jgi:arginase
MELGLLGVPSSAGAHTPGQEGAIGAVRGAGLAGLLQSSGAVLTDYGDLSVAYARPDPSRRRAQNLPGAAAVARDVADRVDAIVRDSRVPLVIGGDCSVTVGVVSGVIRGGLDPSLLYVDGGVDLYVPDTQPEGHLDSMGVAHMIGEPGATAELSGIGPRSPLLDPARIVFYGPCLEHTEDAELRVLRRHDMRAFALPDIGRRAEAAAGEARALLEGYESPFLVHFDVDVLDFVECPISDVPHYEHGMTLADAMASLAVFVGSPLFGGLVVTEINPDHGDPEGAAIRSFVRALASTLARAYR